MHRKTLALAGLVGLALAGAAQAAPLTSVQAFLDDMQDQADARIAEAGVNVDGAARLRFSVDANGHVWGVRILRSSGSAAADAQMEQALRRIEAPRLPADLLGANVTLVIAPDGQAHGSAQ